MIDYKKHRWFLTSAKTLVVGGKNAKQNDSLLKEIIATGENYYILHTSAPGSPFSVIMREPEKVTKEEISECAIATACFSKAWKMRKRTACVDIFRTNQLSKNPSMKEGMWRVAGQVEKITVPLELALVKQRGTLRAVSPKTAKNVLMRVVPGTIDKTDMAAKLGVELGDAFSHDEIIAALPAGGVRKKL